MTTQRAPKEQLEKATELFWSVVANAFPEMTSGDSQITGEDEGALSVWVNGNSGDRPRMKYDMVVPAYISNKRIDKSVAEGIEAAGEVLFTSPGAPKPKAGEDVVDQLRMCVCHVLHFNLPDKKPRKSIRP